MLQPGALKEMSYFGSASTSKDCSRQPSKRGLSMTECREHTRTRERGTSKRTANTTIEVQMTSLPRTTWHCLSSNRRRLPRKTTSSESCLVESRRHSFEGQTVRC